MKKMQLFLYNFIVYLILPLTIVKLLYRGIKNRDYLKNWAERFAIYPNHQRDIWKKRKTVWIHCVSVGETKAIYTLLEKFQKKFPSFHFLITNGTPTGRKVELPSSKKIHRSYLPYDANFLVSRFLQIYQPKIGILIEKEIWPNLINQCDQKKIPLLLINGRLSNESFKKYYEFKKFYTPLFNKLSKICVQNSSDKKNFAKLTSNEIQVMGNLKFDQAPPTNTSEKSKLLKKELKINKQIVIVAGSTRDGEEEIILDQIVSMKRQNITLILVPRHPERFSKVEGLLKSKKIKFVKRSQSSSVNSTPNVVLGDTMNEIYIYYQLADVVIIGGSFLNYGSQNPIEALKMRKPTIIGPSIYNFKDVVTDAIKSNALVKINRIGELPLVIKKYYEFKKFYTPLFNKLSKICVQNSSDKKNFA
ncbi:MAG: hypothetical protein HOJ59_01600, partial [Nitrosomonadales bacterium]|nr:hypothetical protein [Nitrosomonadales bacterium]